MAELHQAFEELEALAVRYDPISLLGQLTLASFFVREDEFHPESSEIVNCQRRIEFLAAFFLVRPYPHQPTERVDGSVLDHVEKLLNLYFVEVDRHMLFDRARDGKTSEQDTLLAKAKIESFHVRGDAYPHQFYAFAQDLYGPHDAWFSDHLGFTIADAVKISTAISREYSRRFNLTLKSAREKAHQEANEFIAKGVADENQRKIVEERIFCSLQFGQPEKILAFTAEELSSFSGASFNTCESFLKRMAQEFGHRNPNFPESFIDPEKAPWDYNALHERPLVNRDGRYWLFVPPLLRSAVFTTFYFDLMQDAGYRSKFEMARGSYLERQTAECLRRIFPPMWVVLNPLYPNGDEMADVMVLHDHKIFLFQCKSKALTYRARIGENFDTLRDDAQKAIADAFQQGVRAREYLQRNERAEFSADAKTFAIDMETVNEIYIIVVTAMPFRILTSRFGNTNSTLGLFPSNEYPWCLSVGDLDVVTQILVSPAQFIHYALRRREVENTPFQVEADEMDYLGFYMSNGMRFDMADLKGMDSVGLLGMSEDVDRWIFEKFERGQSVDRPASAPIDGFVDFVEDVGRTGDDYATDCALALLDLSVAGRKSFMEMIVQTKEKSRQDSQLHSFSVVLNGGKRGFSFVTLNARSDRQKVHEQAVSFAIMKKYQSKCDEWLGFGWDVESSRIVDVASFISEPWCYSEEMERFIRDHFRPPKSDEL